MIEMCSQYYFSQCRIFPSLKLVLPLLACTQCVIQKKMILQGLSRQHCLKVSCGPLAKLILLELLLFLVAPRNSQCKRCIELTPVTEAIAVFPLSYHWVTSSPQTLQGHCSSLGYEHELN